MLSSKSRAQEAACVSRCGGVMYVRGCARAGCAASCRTCTGCAVPLQAGSILGVHAGQYKRLHRVWEPINCMYLIKAIRYKLKARPCVLSRREFGGMHVGTSRWVLRDLGCLGGFGGCCFKRKAPKDSIWAFLQFDQNTQVRGMCLGA